MKITVLTICCFVFSFKANAQTKISSTEIAKHINDSVTVCEQVSGGRYLERSQLTLINLGGAFPNQIFTVVIKGADRSKFKIRPEEDLINKKVCVTGKVTDHNGKPQIQIFDPAQLKIE